jgi:hypothetical protein
MAFNEQRRYYQYDQENIGKRFFHLVFNWVILCKYIKINQLLHFDWQYKGLPCGHIHCYQAMAHG